MIITDASLLRIDCADVLPDEVDGLRLELERELRLSGEAGRPGIGLAAPQIGIAKKMAIVRVTNPNGKLFSIDLVNCEIAIGYDLKVFDGEGCLSFPGRLERTMRYNEVHVRNNMVEPHSFIAQGLLAVCIQHELGHLSKQLLIDVALPKK